MRLYPAPNGQMVPLTEQTKAITVRVTRNDIKKGVAGSSQECAFAQAVIRSLPGAVWARFERTVAYIGFEDHVDKYGLPKKSRDALVIFDVMDGAFAQPGVYVLGAITPGATLNAKKRQNVKRPGGRAVKPGSRPNTGIRQNILTTKGVRYGNGRIQTHEATA